MILYLQLLKPSGGTLAQLVEQRTENPCVPGSIPGGTTQNPQNYVFEGFFMRYTSQANSWLFFWIAELILLRFDPNLNFLLSLFAFNFFDVNIFNGFHPSTIGDKNHFAFFGCSPLMMPLHHF